MFAIIVAGRLVQTNFEKVTDAQILFNIENVDNINHIVVFLTGAIPFPENMGGAAQNSMDAHSLNWHYMGHLSNHKPSAIFKISELKNETKSLNSFASTVAIHNVAQIGISIEPLTNIEALEKIHNPKNNAIIPSSLLSKTNQQKNSTDLSVHQQVEFAVKMLQNFYNFAASYMVSGENIKQALISTFGTEIPEMSKDGSKTYFPSNILEQWYNNFMNKIKLNPHFWKNVTND